MGSRGGTQSTWGSLSHTLPCLQPFSCPKAPESLAILRAPNFVPIPAPCNGCTHDNGGKQALGYRNNHATSVVCNGTLVNTSSPTSPADLKQPGCNFLQSSGGSQRGLFSGILYLTHTHIHRIPWQSY